MTLNIRSLSLSETTATKECYGQRVRQLNAAWETVLRSGVSSYRAGSRGRVQGMCFSAFMQPLAKPCILPKSPEIGLWLHMSLLRAHPTFATAMVSAHSLLSNMLLAQPLSLRCLTPCPNDTIFSLPLNCIHDISEHASPVPSLLDHFPENLPSPL